MKRQTKSILKTISWLLLSSLLLIGVTFLFTGQILLAMEVAGVELVIKAVVYYAHEHLWEHGLDKFTKE